MLTRIAVTEADFRLSRAVRPTHYRLNLEPHFEDDNFTVYGEASTSLTAVYTVTRCKFARSKVGLNSALYSNQPPVSQKLQLIPLNIFFGQFITSFNSEDTFENQPPGRSVSEFIINPRARIIKLRLDLKELVYYSPGG